MALRAVEQKPGAPRRRRIQGSGAALAGVLFAVLFVWGFYLLDYQVDQSAADLTAFYSGAGGTAILLAGGYLVPFAGICFIWFLAATRHRISQLTLREDALLATVQLSTGILFVASFYVAAAAAVASVASVRLAGDDAVVDPALSGTMTAFGQAMLMIYGLRIAAVFMIATTTRAMRAGLFPRWFALVSYVAALVLMVALSYVRAVVLVLPIWVGAVSAVILFRRVAHRFAEA
ncbi:conserved membrane hypothetical protein [Nostocoides japonicum T1-X7]|uniref:Integral membrane protein n=1 Tax=Nostocoides japonicum T1-X7 TaxID=1194083 RepID=A0A077LX22_9MICO|nr:hypothetical protein [Tetrasphaera japonica]CCH76485.1 conserved membrane hypothetical protein [Tetrasphaera japonica T1-X7]